MPPPTLQDLELAINNLLNHPLGITQFRLNHRTADKAYEAYVFGLCLHAVRELGGTPVLRGINGVPDPFIFRGAPGQIHSDRENYGFAEFQINGHEFEIHAGVEFKGTSSMTHELDVCIMRAEDARRCRSPQTRDDPPAASLVAGWECKFYATNLQKGLGRAFVGLIDDMGSNIRTSGLCTNSDSAPLREYFQPKGRPYPHFQLTPFHKPNENNFIHRVIGELKKLTGMR